MLYPYHKDYKTKRSSLIHGLNMLDFIDMAELMFTDLGCFQTYSDAWLGFFYFSLGVTVILTAFSWGVEQKEKNDEVEGPDRTCTFLRMLFTDLSFFILRVYTMVQSKHVYFGLLFAMKEFFAFSFRLVLLCCG